MKFKKILLILLSFFLILSLVSCTQKESEIQNEDKMEKESEDMKDITIEKIESLPDMEWQRSASFPDRLGKVDDTLAMNSILSFYSYEDQGSIYLKVNEGLKSFDCYVNTRKINEEITEPGIYKLNIENASINGLNSLQISSVKPQDASIEVYIPYPTILEGEASKEGFHVTTLDLISDLIQSDVDHGFPGAQLAILRHGKLVYAKTWGYLNAYEPDGTKIENPTPADNNTMYDLASVTKMFGCNYAIQKLVEEGKLSLKDKVCDYLGDAFYEDTLDFSYSFGEDADLYTQQSWKASITVEDLLKHQAGFPPTPRYFNLYVDAPTQDYLPEEAENLLYSGYEHNDETRQNTLEAICKTPLLHEPGTSVLYSDVDYMTLAFVIEEISGLRLDEYMKENFFEPLGLTRISFNPLENGYTKQDCAATELNGNTRDGAVDFPGIRTYTLQGEVHDEMAYHSMNGISGHAGLFSNAIDLAKLASLMLTGGYEGHHFFSRDLIDTFIAPISKENANAALGWARQGDDRRSWYFSCQASSNTIGHQGWTGTLVMIDPQNDVVMAYLTNERNTSLPDKEANANDFNGLYYTASTLGFVPQIFMIGLDQEGDVSEQLKSLLNSMCDDAERLAQGSEEGSAAYLNYLSKKAVLEKWQSR